jgi:hypothetical protein
MTGNRWGRKLCEGQSVAALLLPGLIKRTGNGNEKKCELTLDGESAMGDRELI